MSILRMMIVWAVIICINNINGHTISIIINPTGQGDKGTCIKCLINMTEIQYVREVIVNAYTNKKSTPIVIYYDYGETILSDAGEYLRGRVTYNTITSRTNRTELCFLRLLCEDDKDYQCHLLYVPPSMGPSLRTVSKLRHLAVTGSCEKLKEAPQKDNSNKQRNINIGVGVGIPFGIPVLGIIVIIIVCCIRRNRNTSTTAVGQRFH